MEYNTQREDLQLPEYGRNIQKMVEHAASIEDRATRQAAAETIVKVMGQIYQGQKKNNEDIQHKFWDHIFIISGFQLDVDSPYPKPTPETFQEKPERVPYPKRSFKYRQYGETIELLIEKACTLDEGPEKDDLTLAIANLMKRSYLQWNRDSVNDEVILDHLKELSGGKLELKDPSRLVPTNEVLQSNNKKKKKKSGSSNRNNRSKKKN